MSEVTLFFFKKIRSKISSKSSIFIKKSPFVLFPRVIGYRLYVIALFAFIASLFETLGLSMIAPLLSNASNAGEITGWINKTIIDYIQKINVAGIDNVKIKIFIFLIFLFYLKSIGTFWVGYSIALVKANFLSNIRLKLFDHLLKTPVSVITEQQSSYYSNLLVGQADRSVVSLGFFVQALTKYLSAILYLIFGLFLAPEFGITTLIACAFVVSAFRVLSAQVNRISSSYSEQNSQLANLITSVLENLKYLTVTRQKDGPLSSRLFTSISLVSNLQKDISTKEALTVAARDAVIITILAIVLMPRIKEGAEISVHLVSILLMYRAMSATMMAQKVMQNAQEYYGSFLHLHKVLEFKDTPSENFLVNDEIILEPNWSEIRVVNLAIEFNGSTIFEKVNLKIRRGSFFCIMGPSGTGKTTLVDIVLGITNPTSGHVEFLSTSEFKETQKSQIGYVTQSTAIFAGTVLENVTMWAPHYNLAKVQKVLQDVGLPTSDSENKTFLSRQVDKLSGGEKQRLAFARELYRGVDILILDEPTSALDADNRDTLLQQILSTTGKTTVIAITHDPEFAAKCEDIFTFGRDTNDDQKV